MDENLDFYNKENSLGSEERLVRVTGMYKDWFLDYATYVILERAIPHIFDGLKPVQRRILHSMKELDDGRFNKVANIVGGYRVLGHQLPYDVVCGKKHIEST